MVVDYYRRGIGGRFHDTKNPTGSGLCYLCAVASSWLGFHVEDMISGCSASKSWCMVGRMSELDIKTHNPFPYSPVPNHLPQPLFQVCMQVIQLPAGWLAGWLSVSSFLRFFFSFSFLPGPRSPAPRDRGDRKKNNLAVRFPRRERDVVHACMLGYLLAVKLAIRGELKRG